MKRRKAENLFLFIGQCPMIRLLEGKFSIACKFKKLKDEKAKPLGLI